jgi:hypothetical protein
MSGEDDLARKLLPLGAFAGAAADADLRQPSGSSWASSFSAGAGAAPPAAALAGRSSDSLMGSSPPQALSLAALSSLLTRTTSGPAEEQLLMQLQQQLEAIAGSGGAAGAAAMFEGMAAASALPGLGLRGPGLPAHLQPGGAAPLQVLLGGGRGDEGSGGSSELQPLHAFLSVAGRVTAAASAATQAAAKGRDEAASSLQRLERSGRSDASTSAAVAASVTGGVPAAAGAARGEAQGESGGGAAADAAEDEAPQLVRELGVSLESMERLFTADTQQEFKQPVWMVVNLQVWGAVIALRDARAAGPCAGEGGDTTVAQLQCGILADSKRNIAKDGRQPQARQLMYTRTFTHARSRVHAHTLAQMHARTCTHI